MFTVPAALARLAAAGRLDRTSHHYPSGDDHATASAIVAGVASGEIPAGVVVIEGDPVANAAPWLVRIVPQVGMGATRYGYSDCHPYEVVRVVSATCVDVRAMRAEGGLTADAQVIPGGFCAHVVDQGNAQEWAITSAPDAPVVRLRLDKRGRWVHKGEVYGMGAARRFHDYNF